MTDLSPIAQGWLDIWRQADSRITDATAVTAVLWLGLEYLRREQRKASEV